MGGCHCSSRYICTIIKVDVSITLLKVLGCFYKMYVNILVVVFIEL